MKNINVPTKAILLRNHMAGHYLFVLLGSYLQYQNGSCEAAFSSISEEGRPVDRPHEVQKMQGITRSLRFSTARRSLGMTPRGKCGLFHTSMERFFAHCFGITGNTMFEGCSG